MWLIFRFQSILNDSRINKSLVTLAKIEGMDHNHRILPENNTKTKFPRFGESWFDRWVELRSQIKLSGSWPWFCVASHKKRFHHFDDKLTLILASVLCHQTQKTSPLVRRTCKQKLKPERWEFYLIKTNLFHISRGKEIIAAFVSSSISRMDIKSKNDPKHQKSDITSYITASILKHYANGINFNMLLTYGDNLVCDAIIHDKIAFDNTRNTIKNGELFGCW